jgi:diguanylate cyclase (GGDEF)-like protein
MYVMTSPVTGLTRRTAPPRAAGDTADDRARRQNRRHRLTLRPRTADNRGVTLVEASARVMHLAQDGNVEGALAEAERALASETAQTSAAERAGLWYAVATAELVRGATTGGRSAAERCLALALEANSGGWASAALSVRAVAQARGGRMEPALLDLGRAEAELLTCDDTALRCWAHAALGSSYLELRLYELAQPHLERALQLDASPMPLPEAPVLNVMNLVELHVRWADELERAKPYDGSERDAEAHRSEGHAYAVRAVERARALDQASLVATCRAMELASLEREAAARSLSDLREAFDSDAPPAYQGAPATVGGALARALWSLGRREEAVEVARRAATLSAAAQDWQVAASARWLLVEMEALSGVPGAASGRAYAELLSRVLWQQRLSTLQGAQAALQVERLHRDKEQAQRAASEDPLTRVGNRRALDDALRDLRAEAPADPGSTPITLLVVDLDDFKSVNDTHGHVVGDEVLREVAAAVRRAARSRDVVARLGGDEFVVLARGADADAGRHLAERVTAAVGALRLDTGEGAPLRLSASVGVATAQTAEEAALLLARADAAMYEVKEAGRSRRRVPRPRRPPE